MKNSTYFRSPLATVYLFSFSLFSMSLSSCTKLTEDPKSTVVATNFYKTQSDAIAAVTAVYSDLAHDTHDDHASIYNRLLVLAVGMSSDDNLPGPQATNPDVRSIAALTSSATNGRYDELWRQHYEAIDRANAAIDRIPAINFDPVLKARLINEAKFIRGLLYFNLVRLWGDVPLVIHEATDINSINVPRTATADVYKQIIQDLKDAENLPLTYPASDAGRATGGAARSILLDVYVTTQDWNDAIAKYQEINALNVYHLFPNYADIFNVAKTNTQEHIFTIQFAADATFKFDGTGNNNVLSPISAPPIIGGFDADIPHSSVSALYSPQDKRGPVTVFNSITLSGGPVTFPTHFKKYIDLTNLPALYQSTVPIPVIRYAEVLLFYAEALNEKSGPSQQAYDALDSVRNRAGLPNLTAGLSQDQFRDSLYLERRREFVYEQIRWFDLIRTKRLVSELKQYPDKANVSDKYYLLPIPQHEIDINSSLQGHQNPGWN